MALFSGNRDTQLFRKLSDELVDRILGTEIDIYKISNTLTKENVYGEAVRKIYKTAVRVGCIITPEDKEWADNGIGEDISQLCNFAFVRETIKDIELVIQVGDIFKWDASYWEVDSVNDEQYHMAHNPDTSTLGTEFGASISILCKTHMARRSSLSLENTNIGNVGIIPDNI